MPHNRTPILHNRKRKLSVDTDPTTDSSPPPTTKRQKLEKQPRHRTPSWFWDNLSRLWLTPRALGEFDRRTVGFTTPLPPESTGKENIDLALLKRFARHGGPSLDNLRGYPDPDMAPSKKTMSSGQSGSRTRIRKTNAYDAHFEQNLIDHGIYPQDYNGVRNLQEPHNSEEIMARLALPRASLSPSRFTREAFLDFREKNREALTENTVMTNVIPIIAGSARIPHSENIQFGNLVDLTDGSITKAQPDFYDGSRPAEINKHIREELGPYIVPSTNTAAPCLPNFFAEGKGPNGSMAVCERQALYDGAIGARGIHELRSYAGQDTLYDNNAYTLTSIYQGGTGFLKLCTVHPTSSTNPGRPTEYRMTQLNGWDMTANLDTFRQGASALRNARDWAKEKREELIAAANHKAQDPEISGLSSSTQSDVPLSSNEPTHPESETSAEGLDLDVDTFPSTSHRSLGGGRTEPLYKASSNRRVNKEKNNYRVNKRSDKGFKSIIRCWNSSGRRVLMRGRNGGARQDHTRPGPSQA